ncbi:hypothetical protein ACOSQ4_005238 [Xanthoceras sorbifolium]
MKLFYLLLAIVAVIIEPIQAIQYLVTNNATGTPGGTRFENEIGIPYSEQTLQLATEFILQTFRQDGNYNPPHYDQITTIVYSFTFSPARHVFDTIYLSSDYIENYSGDVRIEVIGILYHETSHVWQWTGNSDSTPQGLIEGIADYIRLKAGWAPMHWAKRGSGSRWDDGYEITAYFLEYCNGLRDGFVAEINSLMEYMNYSDDFFVQLLGKSVDDLWNDYKSQYGN